MLAALRGQKEVVQLLMLLPRHYLHYLHRVQQLQCPLSHVQLLQCPLFADLKPFPHCMQMLQQGFPPDSSDYDQRTGLMLAALRGHKEVVELLIAAGAPVDQKDAFGQTALSEACKNAQDDMINLLKTAGAK